MLKLIPDLPDHVVGVEAEGVLTADDYKQVLEPALDAAAGGGRRLRVLAVLGPAFEGFGERGAMEDLRTGLAHWSSWERMAIVTADSHIATAVRWLGWLVPGDIRVFGLDEREAATRWVLASEPAG